MIGVTGASGVIYAVRLVEVMLRDPDVEAHLIVSPSGQRVLADELTATASKKKSPSGHGVSSFADSLKLSSDQRNRLTTHPFANIGAGPASGTFKSDGMVIVPCSMNTLGAVANGLSSNLLTRAAAVTLKEGRPLILVPRETPFTLIDLRNMTQIAEAGGVILPANPGFYHRPKNVEEVIAYVVQKIMDRLGLDYPDPIRWGEK